MPLVNFFLDTRYLCRCQIGGRKYRPPGLQIIFTGFCKHKSNNITPGWDCGTCEWAKPEPYCGQTLILRCEDASKNSNGTSKAAKKKKQTADIFAQQYEIDSNEFSLQIDNR